MLCIDLNLPDGSAVSQIELDNLSKGCRDTLLRLGTLGKLVETFRVAWSDLGKVEGAVGDEVVDNAALWISEDRACRLELLERMQSIKGTKRVEAGAVGGASIEQVLAAMGAKAPKGDALIAWKLSQRVDVELPSMQGLAEWLERQLKMPVKILREPREWPPSRFSGTAEEVIDAAVKNGGLFFKIKDGTVVIGAMEDLVK